MGDLYSWKSFSCLVLSLLCILCWVFIFIISISRWHFLIDSWNSSVCELQLFNQGDTIFKHVMEIILPNECLLYSTSWCQIRLASDWDNSCLLVYDMDIACLFVYFLAYCRMLICIRFYYLSYNRDDINLISKPKFNVV